MKFIGSTEEYLQMELIGQDNCKALTESIESSLTILWFEAGTHQLVIDGKLHFFSQDQIVFLTEFHKVEIKKTHRIRLLRFNRPFYCVLDHDEVEVGCKGILFFGASQLPVIEIPGEEKEKFDTLWKMFCQELRSNDNLQKDMLQMMLKRYLILCTRLYKTQVALPQNSAYTDLLREFNFLVEQHFREKHTVSDYAAMLHKSPKTISNIFSKIGKKTPLQYIHERKMLEAKKLLHYSNLQIKEIASEIGYEDIQTFDRFFKRQTGVSPTTYKENR